MSGSASSIACFSGKVFGKLYAECYQVVKMKESGSAVSTADNKTIKRDWKIVSERADSD